MSKPVLILRSCALTLMFAVISCSQRAAVKTPKPAPPVASTATTSAREERLVITYVGVNGKTALELLKSLARVRTSSSQIGELVEEINSVSNGEGHYLIYFVNGAMAKTGAGNYVTKDGEKIEWRLIGPRK
jgi:hypothetical protein